MARCARHSVNASFRFKKKVLAIYEPRFIFTAVFVAGRWSAHPVTTELPVTKAKGSEPVDHW